MRHLTITFLFIITQLYSCNAFAVNKVMIKDLSQYATGAKLTTNGRIYHIMPQVTLNEDIKDGTVIGEKQGYPLILGPHISKDRNGFYEVVYNHRFKNIGIITGDIITKLKVRNCDEHQALVDELIEMKLVKSEPNVNTCFAHLKTAFLNSKNNQYIPEILKFITNNNNESIEAIQVEILENLASAN